MRRFNPKWFQEYPDWLEYSVSNDTAYCLYCYLFKDSNIHQGGGDVFSTIGFKSWNKKKSLWIHVGKPNNIHNQAKKRCEYLSRQQQSIKSAFGRGQSDQFKQEYGLRLTASIDVVRLLVNQGFAFRGHDESKSSLNKGNFLEILSWYAKHCDKIHDYVLEHAPQNDRMTSPMIQKDIVTACKIETIKAIIEELNGDYFALLVDESFDVSRKEQMAVVLRYVDRKGFVMERLIDIVHVQDTSALSLKSAIVNLLSQHSLSLSYVRGQELGLIRAGDTRWGSHYKSFCNFILMFGSITDVLDALVVDAYSPDESAKATGYLEACQTFKIAFMLHLMRDILGITDELNKSLQKKEQDIANAMLLVEVAKRRLQSLREDAWDELIDKVSTFCIKYNILIPNFDEPYVNSGRLRRKPADHTVLHHYRYDVFYKIIDWQLQELNDRFNEVTTDLLHGVACLNPVDSFSSFNIKKIMRMAELYPDDFDEFSRGALENQLATYIIDVRDIDERFANMNGICDVSKKLVQTKKHLNFPLVFRLVKFSLLLPVATASVERAFSAMKFIKNDLRNRMNDGLLSGCLVPYVEKDVFINISNDAIVKTFQEMKPRKLDDEGYDQTVGGGQWKIIRGSMVVARGYKMCDLYLFQGFICSDSIAGYSASEKSSKDSTDQVDNEDSDHVQNDQRDFVDAPVEDDVVGQQPGAIDAPESSSEDLLERKCVFRVKYEDGNPVPRYKAKLVVKGFNQKKGVDFDEIFSSIVKMLSIQFTKWKRPPLGWIKVNTDGNRFGDGIIGAGGIVRDHEGNMVMAFA
ncbi:uncharacterized protein LOC132631440 [Lycium barbarum]|uniref:uncharacterized protein LOC132631440 n=1 Tax=Lycium barbarum TaxID=112863 RepID=UPI00293F57CD|nr:uncharacterized protein LOC132631440 [Lycium barbarum]